MSAATRFVLLRHGEASGNRELRYLGASDVALTERGRAQALRLAQAALRYRLDAIYTSPLIRARTTAEALAAAAAVPLQLCVELREQDFGAWELRTRAEVLAAEPGLLAAWEAGDEIAPPGGESLNAVRARVVACADDLARRHPGQTLALVSHVGPIKALVCAALGLPAAGAQRLWLDVASICVVDWPAPEATAARRVLRVFNDISHLDPPRWLERGSR
jgi:broad specificity phosphatase PhoE